MHRAGAAGAIALIGLHVFNALQGQFPAAELLWRVPVAAAVGYGLVFLSLYFLNRIPKAIRSVTHAPPAQARSRSSSTPRDSSNLET